MTADLTPIRRSALLSKYTSRCNKIALCADGCAQWRWAGRPFASRIELLLDGAWVPAKSYEDDIRPGLKFGKEER